MPDPEVLGLSPGARLDVHVRVPGLHQALGVKVESSQPLGNPFVSDRDGYFSAYVVPAEIDLVIWHTDGVTETLADVLVLDPRVGQLEQRVAALMLARAGS